ncbi:hypothetical protein DAEQUDRAFT_52914 [Daedalea quercina L-15889]|uniref:Uncharacterized protein n=1 Tax=Daedalea quercina L-15889 TaxID=1314783 RepID=A0A165L9G1_9APHY|nr:hypothetical protein DAEQUDRAFT_52914 [Daedalea quercina L-15889]
MNIDVEVAPEVLSCGSHVAGPRRRSPDVTVIGMDRLHCYSGRVREPWWNTCPWVCPERFCKSSNTPYSNMSWPLETFQ